MGAQSPPQGALGTSPGFPAPSPGAGFLGGATRGGTQKHLSWGGVCMGAQRLPPPLRDFLLGFPHLLEPRTWGTEGRMDTGLPPALPTTNSLLPRSSKPGAVAGAQLVHSEPLCQSGKGPLSSRHFTSSCQKTVIINTRIGHICDGDSAPHRQCPCAALTGQSELGWDTMHRPPAARPLVFCSREQRLGPLGASGKVAPLVEQTEGPGRGSCRAEGEG